MKDHFTAWVTTDPSPMFADVTVCRDEWQDTGTWQSTDDIRLTEVLNSVFFSDTLQYDVLRAAERALTDNGWVQVGDWVRVPTGYIVTVERVEK